MNVVPGLTGLLVVFGLGLAGCAGHAEVPETAERELSVVATAAVVSVDQDTRQVLLRTESDELIRVVAGPEVRNLAQIEAGDQVRVEYYEAVAARLAEPGEPSETTGLTATGRAAEGEKPGGYALATSDFVVEVVSYDPDTASAVVVMPDGAERAVSVAPEMRAFAAARQPGDRVRLTLATAVAVTLTEHGD